MDAIGLNPIKLDAIGLDPIRMNAIRLGVPGASSGSGRPYIDPELLSHIKMAISTWGKSNDDPDRTVLKDLSGNGNDMRLLNFGFTEGSGYGLPGTDFEGWLCTDGVDDIIESVKPVSEMLEGSNEITVVSIIHGIGSKNAYTNVLRESGSNYIRNTSTADGKTGIYGYTCKDTTKSIITDILGDKNDYKLEYIQTTTPSTVNSVFSVAGWRENNGSMIVYPVAYAGGFIANKVLTTDEINQIIAYFNLDRPGQIIKPQLYCNIKKQGITNDNHAEFNDQLIDFVGGHNIQLNNISWEGESGINSYPVVFGANKTWNVIRANDGIDWRYTLLANKITIYKIETSNKSLIYSYVHTASGSNSMTVPAFKIKVDGLKAEESIIYDYISSDNTARSSRIIIRDNGLYDLPVSVPIQVTEITPASVLIGFTIALNDNVSKEGLTIEVLPTIENALCLDGISDFGKATGLPVLKDYTVVADREIKKSTGGVVSKNTPNGAFVCEVTGEAYSYGAATPVSIDYKRKLSYQSKYIYNGNPIQAGTGVDSDSMWLGTVRNGDPKFSKLALSLLMLFPYSLSKFLLERQLRKYKAGILYPDMIEFRPIVKSNIPYLRILYFITSTGDQIIKGSYIPIGSVIQINIQTVNATDEISSVSVNGKEVDMYNKDETYWRYRFKVTKSPQKINITINENI
ncbi:hypothetical protein ACMSEA_05015 [Bacteroides thetaiotaomicron]|uniref:hypothetical protein n=1 Tax=Bacteroides thetaiotaomicron TaxID=818 RepID=UPI0039C2E817